MRPIALAVAASLLLASGALAQDKEQALQPPPNHSMGMHGDGHAERHDWYKNLTQPGTGYSCCNGTVSGPNGSVVEGDCRPTRAYLSDDGTWRAMVDGRWIPVPPRVVLQTLAPDGNSHICASKGGMIFCFIGGSPKS